MKSISSIFVFWVFVVCGCNSSSSDASKPSVQTKPTEEVRVEAPTKIPPEEQVEHPNYSRWAKHKLGTVVIVKEATISPQIKKETTTTYKLKQLTEKEAVVEVSGAIQAPDGSKIEHPAQDFRYSRWARAKTDKEKANIGKPEGFFEEKDEMITVLGKEYKTKVYRCKGRVEAGETETFTWISDDFPGGVVRSTTKVLPTNQITSSEIMEVIIP